MELSHIALGIYESDDPGAAFQALAKTLAVELPLQCALLVDADERAIAHRWPPGAEVSADLMDMALHVIRPEVFPLGSEFPHDAVTFKDADLLLLPLRGGDARSGLCVLIGSEGCFGEELEPWDPVVRSLEHVHARHRKLKTARDEAEELRRRVEESEALHTLGLAANRTLDKDEVLNLVARFTRTLLGAHYVTVSTLEGERVLTAASVGVRDASGAGDDYHLARAVVEAEKPLTVGGSNANLQVENFPYHAAEGMKAGLGIPLSLFGETFGALVVGYRRDYVVEPRDVRLALTLAGHAAVAISNANLHETVEERSQELAAAYEELSRLSEAKERFFASINHELRNPVGAIMGYQTLILDGITGDIPDAARRYLDKAQRAAQNLLTLVNDILDLSKIAAGKMDLEIVEIPVQELLDRVLDIIRPLAEQKEVQLIVAPTDGLPLIRTDPLRAQQILVNLLSNAVKFTRGEVRLTARAVDLDAALPVQDAPAGEGWLEIEVADTGEGIPPDDLPRIFEEYEQVKGTKGGTGLGLPISRRLARALGGELWAESEVGVGSKFVLRLAADAASRTRSS